MKNTLRPPAVPLVTHDPYFSIWSFSDQLTDSPTRHWTGAQHRLTGTARIDGKSFRFCGMESTLPAMEQISLTVLPTRTIYQFKAGGICLTLTFLTPALPHDLDILSRPATYVIFNVRSLDKRPHTVSIYWGCAAEITVNSPNDEVIWSRLKLGDMTVLSAGSKDQKLLSKVGDDLRIDWGYLYLAASEKSCRAAIGSAADLHRGFIVKGTLPTSDDFSMPRPAAPVSWEPLPTVTLALTFDFGKVGAKEVERHAILAYDDLFSLEYMHRKLRPWWRRDGKGAVDLLINSEKDFSKIKTLCKKHDDDLTRTLRANGGEKYAQMGALAYRQCLAAHKLVADHDGSPVFMSKENFSNGCINTVDVTYPSAPFFLLLNPELLKAQLTPILDYAQSPRWKFPFAPHDLGTYPLANGQVYGGGEKTEKDQMPVEECGNMLILIIAYVHYSGDTAYAEKYGNLLHKWADYLLDKGLDPDNQLCTDDFAGHLTHNTNLSLKAIVALGCFASLAKKTGKTEEAKTFRNAAEKMAAKWQRMADDGDHYRLTFDKPETWSQKYNLVWDQLLDLHLFPDTVARKEIAYYKKIQNTYGLPLDSRSAYTKLDWTVWCATLAEKEEDFAALTDPLYQWLHETPSRVPMSDWFWTNEKGAHVSFQARSVVGGIFIKALKGKTTSSKRFVKK